MFRVPGSSNGHLKKSLGKNMTRSGMYVMSKRVMTNGMIKGAVFLKPSSMGTPV
jgi:hypothetical protein